MTTCFRSLGVASLALLATMTAPSVFGQITGTAAATPISHHKSTTIIGKDVKNKQGENLGEIQDLVFNKSGKISFAVLSFGGFLGMGDKYFAIPWESLTAGPDATFVLDVDKARLKQAPGFDKKSWPDMADATWASEVDRYYSPRNAPDRSWGGKADSLKSAVVKNPAGTKLGSVEGIMVDLSHGRATMVIIHTEDSVNPKDRWLAIPWNAMTVVPKDNYFTLNASETSLAQAPSFGKDGWPDMDRTYTAGVFRHFGRDLDAENAAGTPWAEATTPVVASICCRTSEMVGATCQTSANENLGTVKDLILATDRGQVSFVILDTRANDARFRAVPWSLCHFTKAGACIIASDAATLGNAPSFPEKEWPDFTDQKCRTGIFDHFGVKDEHLMNRGG